MKKKILFSLILTVLLTCLFVVGVSAATIYKDANGTEMFRYETYADSDEVATALGYKNDKFIGTIKSYSGSFPKTDAEGNAITWYVTGTSEDADGNTIKTVASFITADSEWCTISSAGNYQFNTSKGVNYRNVVSVNFPNDKNIQRVQNGTNSYGLYAAMQWSPTTNELLFARFPNTYNYNKDDRMVQGTKILEVEFDKDIQITTFADTCFYGCRNLREIVIPKSVEKMTGTVGVLYECVNMTSVTFEEGSKLTTLGSRIFKDCDSLTEITFPNTLTTIGERIVENCDSLVKVNFGSNLGNLTQSLIYQSYKVQYIYLSKTITASAGSHALSSSDGTYAKSVIFFNGTYDEALALKALVTANGTGNNQKISHDNFIKWDSTQTDDYYVELATSEGKNYVVYGYNTCQAFYDGKHTESGTPTYEYKGEEYLSNYVAISACSVCGITDSETLVCGPLFINKGYAKEENGSLFTYGIVVDKDEIAKYVAHTGKAFNYGMIVAAGDLVNDGALFDESAKAIDGTIIIDVTTTKYTVYQLKMTGIKDSQKDLSVYACAYVIDGTAVSYIGEETTDSAVAISYNQIKALITNNTTGNGEATENTDAA